MKYSLQYSLFLFFEKDIFMAYIMMNNIFSHHLSTTSRYSVIRFLLNVLRTDITINIFSFEIWAISDYL